MQNKRLEIHELWDSSPASTADEIWRLMHQLTFVVANDRMYEVAEEMGLNRTQARFLMQLQPGISVSQKQTASMLHCDPSTVTVVADRLEDLGLVKREIDHADRRARGLTLTTRGKRVRRQLIDRVFKVPGNLLALSDAEQETLRGILKRLVAPA